VWAARLEEQRARRPFIEAILSNLRASVAKLWHFCRVETYGSYSTGLSDSTSDLDLVVCFSDECQSLLGPKGWVCRLVHVHALRPCPIVSHPLPSHDVRTYLDFSHPILTGYDLLCTTCGVLYLTISYLTTTILSIYPSVNLLSVGHIRVVPLLHLLAEYLAKEAGHLIHITNVIIHARVPIIKAVSVDPQLSGAHPNNSNNGSGGGSGSNGGSAAGFTPLHCEGSKYEPISIDISIDSPLHSGLATTEMVCTLMQALPPLGPVVSVVKDYLKLKGLSDAFTGGLNSYGLFILMLLPLLRRLRDSRDLLGCEPIGGVPVPVPAPAPIPATAAAPATSQASSSGTGCPATATASAVPATASTIDSALTDAASNSKVHIDKVPAPSTSTRANVSELKSVGACQISKQGAVGIGLVASDAKCIEVDHSSAAKGSAPSSLPDSAVKGSDRKAPVTTLTAQDTGRTCDCDNGSVKGPLGRVNRVRSVCSECSNIKAGTAAAAVVVSDMSSSSSNNRHLEGQASDDSQGEAEAEAGDGAVKVSSSSKASDQQGGGGKVTSVYMQAVARAAQAQSQRMAGTSTKGGHLAKGSLNKRLKEMNLTIPASSSASSSSEGEDTVVRDAIPVPHSLREKERGSAGIHCLAGAGRALSSILAGGSATCSDESAAISDSGDIELSLETIGGETTLPLSLNTSVDSALSPASPPPSTPQVCGEDTNKHSQLPSSVSASPSSKPMLSSRPPLRPTPPVTLKEYLSVKHSLHSTYTVARSALKPSQSSNVPLPQSPPHQPSPASPKYKPSSPSSTTSASAPSSSSVSTPPKASGPSYDTSPGIALHCSTVNVKSFPAVFTNTHASSGAMATYQYLRPKPPSPFSRQHNISPIATPKQSLGQMQLSSNAKFPMRIIFPSPPPFSSPYKHSSGPSSSSISKAGALYIMNVMNNQRGYTWNNLKQQRDFGRKVAFKLFDLPDNGDFNRSKQRDSSKHNYRNSARDMRVPCVLALEAPILGSLLQDFLLAYGNYH
jgi:Nucleotidyltransferase domain